MDKLYTRYVAIHISLKWLSEARLPVKGSVMAINEMLTMEELRDNCTANKVEPKHLIGLRNA